MAAFKVEGQDVLLLHLENGGWAAYDGRCPHQQVMLVDGKFDGREVQCAAHCWRFDARDGRGINPARTKLRGFAVKCRDDQVFVNTQDSSSLGEPISPTGGVSIA